MINRATIYDLAKAAGVSTTSVYKALHGKAGISDETRDLILKIAEAKGYKINKIAQTLARNFIKVGVIFERLNAGFPTDALNGMKDAFSELSDFKVQVVYGSFGEFEDKARVLNDIHQMMADHVDGIILSPAVSYPEYKLISEKLQQSGIPLILVTNDIDNCAKLSTVSQNYSMVGELGAELLDLFNKEGQNALLIGNKAVTGHKILINGFTKRLETLGLTPVAIYETQDDNRIAYYATEKLLNTYPDVKGIFVGTGHSTGVCRKIVDLGKAGQIKIVCVDTDPEILDYLQQDVVKATIFQNPYEQGKLAVKIMYDYLTENKVPLNPILIDPVVVLKSNISSFRKD